MANKTAAGDKPPKHLRPDTQKWFAGVVAEYELEPHHIKLLTLAAESWDRCQQAREAIDKHGIVYEDRWGAPRKRPEVSVEETARIAVARILRELDLDCGTPGSSPRPPALHSNRREN